MRSKAAAANGTTAASACRVVVHLDLDCYYAQVEQRRLKIPADQPVAVQQWGSLLAVNYVARQFGVLRGACACHCETCWCRTIWKQQRMLVAVGANGCVAPCA